VPPHFRTRTAIPADELRAETVRPDGVRQVFGFVRQGANWKASRRSPNRTNSS
jgi:hypothetical protein